MASSRYINVPLPLEIIVKIAKILYIEECFVELEIVMYTFPELNEWFSYKIPTIVLVDDDQYDKFSNFIHSRERPYGSRDLFVIKQQKTFKSSESTRLKSKCYILLCSRFYQESILKEFRLLEPYVTLVENRKVLKDMNCDKHGYKCYELNTCDTTADPNKFLKQPIKLRYECKYTFHVALLLNTFLKPMNPRLLRFEAYSGKSDLYFEWSDLYFVYCSLINIRHVRKDSFDLVDTGRKDRVIDTPKCCFELVKDINNLTSLHQFSHCGQSETWEWKNRPLPEDMQEKDGVKKNLGNSTSHDDDNQKTAFFIEVKNVSVDKITISKSQNSPSRSFISVDCSTSTRRYSENAYNFTLLYHHFTSSYVRRRLESKTKALNNWKERRHLMSDYELITERWLLCGNKHNWKAYFPYYIDLFFAEFPNEKLQSVDVTAFDPNQTSTTSYTSVIKKKSLDAFSTSSNRLNLKDLECRINKLMNSIQESRTLPEKGPQYEPPICRELSENILETMVREVTNSIESEDINKEAPLKLRVFNTLNQKINDGARFEFVKEWWQRSLDC